MSVRAAQLFAWLQDASFYHDMHVAAANMLAPGDGRSWLDVGCGPGVLTRIAADKCYAAKGVDRDPDMIAAAQRIADERQSAAVFEVSDIETACARGERYDVVSASSLLVVLPDPEAALRRLLSFTKPGGTVLIIEAAPAMTRHRAFAKFLSGRLGRRGVMLLVWAMVRSGRTLPEAIFEQPEWRFASNLFLSGMAKAWFIKTTP